MCKSHYTIDYKRRRYLAHRPSLRLESTGVSRRLRALVALGYSQSEFARQLDVDPSRVSKLTIGYRVSVNAATAAAVTALYDRLSMTPGPSRAARDFAHRRGWMPPLAWDDETIDDPLAVPDAGHQERIGFVERFTELRELGYSDLVIAERLDIRPSSLLRQLKRYDIKPDAALTTASAQERWMK